MASVSESFSRSAESSRPMTCVSFAVALGEERPQRAVDHARGQDLLLVGPALALEEAARDLARGVGVLAVVDGEGHEVDPGPRILLRVGGGQDDGVAQPHHHRAVRLLGHAPRLEGQGVAAQRHFHAFHRHVFFLRSARGRPLAVPERRTRARMKAGRRRPPAALDSSCAQRAPGDPALLPRGFVCAVSSLRWGPGRDWSRRSTSGCPACRRARDTASRPWSSGSRAAAGAVRPAS